MKLHLEIDPDDPRDVEAGERTLRRLRESVGVPVAAPVSPRKPKKKPAPTLPRPRPDELAEATPIIEAQVARDTRGKGMLDR